MINFWRSRVWRWTRPTVLAILATGVVFGMTNRQAMAERTPVILDTDIGDDIDDTWALGLLLKCPELDVRLVVGDQGKSEYRAKLIARMLEVAGRTDVPVGVGLEVNAHGDGPQQAWVQDYRLEDYPGTVHRDGVQAIIDTVMESEKPVTLIGIGPLPNVAAALEREPAIAEKARFVGMHGSVRLGYGGSKEISAEYNVRADAPACRKVLSASWPVTITPLDTCGLVHLTGEKYQHVRLSADPVARAIIQNYTHWSSDRDVVEVRSSTLFDTVAVYLAVDADFVKMEELPLEVTDEGFTVIDSEGSPMRVATEWKNMDAFEDWLVERLTGPTVSPRPVTGPVRRLAVPEYRDKMKAGWVGQMVGVGWGGPTEFRWKGEIIPADEMPVWKPEMVNQFYQDDLYVEMTFLRTLEEHGLEASIRQAGIDFANSGYRLWHANNAGRTNLRQGIAPPDSGHPRFNQHADDIDYQIEADFSGLIAPGMPNVVIELGERFGRLMNYGDGVYGGQFVGGMYAEAFFTADRIAVVEAGLRCVPKGSQFHECIRDVLDWHAEEPVDWQATWRRINEKYHLNPAYRRFSCSGPEGEFNIDAKINAAYIVMGLLYGDGDPDQTIQIATRCGQDSDCNPSNAAGILFTMIGFEQLPERFKSAIDPEGKFSHTPYTFPKLISVCGKLAEAAVVRAGGRVESPAGGGENVLVIPNRPARPSRLEQCWDPGLIASSRYTEAEMRQIKAGK